MNSLVGFAGDWHGTTPWALQRLQAFAAEGVTHIYHVGDFGLWPGVDGETFLRKVNKAATEHGQTLFVVPGNHENYDQIARMTADADGWLVLDLYPALKFAPRGHVWLDGEVRFAALGGAGSVDRNIRVEGKTWWPEEAITCENVDTLVSNVTAHGWDRVDVLLTHDAPAGVHRPGGQLPAWFTPEVAHDCWSQRALLRNAVDLVTPRALVHGHWHRWFEDEIDGVTSNGVRYLTRVWGLPNEGHVDNCVVAEIVPGVGPVNVAELR
jgi:hypothetical protein